MKRLIEILFLRFFAANLMRTRRGEPINACRDAITQLSAVAGTAIVIAIAILSLLVAPSWLRHLYTRDSEFIVVLLIPGVAFAIWSNRVFSRFAESPQAADPYKSRATVRLTNALYVAIPVALVVLLALVLRVLDPPPTP